MSAEHGLGMANLYAALRLKEQKLVEKGKTFLHMLKSKTI